MCTYPTFLAGPAAPPLLPSKQRVALPTVIPAKALVHGSQTSGRAELPASADRDQSLWQIGIKVAPPTAHQLQLWLHHRENQTLVNRVLSFWPPQDIFIKPLLSSPGDMVDISNTKEKNTETQRKQGRGICCKQKNSIKTPERGQNEIEITC